jgi:hypothetical protein
MMHRENARAPSRATVARDAPRGTLTRVPSPATVTHDAQRTHTTK